MNGSSCGDGVCTDSENCSICALDCRSCPIPRNQTPTKKNDTALNPLTPNKSVLNGDALPETNKSEELKSFIGRKIKMPNLEGRDKTIFISAIAIVVLVIIVFLFTIAKKISRKTNTEIKKINERKERGIMQQFVPPKPLNQIKDIKISSRKFPTSRISSKGALAEPSKEKKIDPNSPMDFRKD